MDEIDNDTLLTPEQDARVATLAARIIPNGWNWYVEERYGKPGEYVAYINGITPGKWHARGTSYHPEKALRNAKRNAERLLGNTLKEKPE